MSNHLDSLRRKRAALLADMQAIDHLRRGSLSQQYFKAGPGRAERRGPYFVLQGFFQGKKFSERIPAAQAPQVQAEVDNYRRFQALAEECVTLSDELTRLEAGGADSKKNSSRKRSPPNASRKRPPS
jgi:hypothetical protein